MDLVFKNRLSLLLAHAVEWDCTMARYTSFSIGGPAAALVRVADKKELQALLLLLHRERLSWRVIGRGTNLLVGDEGYEGVIIILDDSFKSITKQEPQKDGTVLLSVGAGCSFGRLQKYCIESGLAGIEFAFGIPGSLGGAVIMNAGAWGDEISSVIDAVCLVTHQGSLAIPGEDLSFSYRSWDGFYKYQGTGVVAEVELKLVLGKVEDIRERCLALHKKRQLSQPHQYPNCGSFFKNPLGDSAGRLIDASGLKGTSVGGAMVSLEHGNFLVNRGNATAAEVKRLMTLIQERVKQEHGIDLEPEVHFI